MLDLSMIRRHRGSLPSCRTLSVVALILATPAAVFAQSAEPPPAPPPTAPATPPAADQPPGTPPPGSPVAPGPVAPAPGAPGTDGSAPPGAFPSGPPMTAPDAFPSTPTMASPPVVLQGPPGALPVDTSATVAPAPVTAATMPAPDDDSAPKGFSHGLQFLYFNVETGFERVGLRTLHTSNLLPATADASGSGAFFGLGGGVNLVFLTLGPRFRTASLDAWSVWTLDLEACIRLPLGRVEPYFIFAGGYAKLDAGSSGATDVTQVSVHGFNARLGLGFDVFATKNITIGASGTIEVLGMSRSGQITSTPQSQAATCESIADPVQKEQCAADAVYAADGSALGIAGTLAIVAGLHF
jgi:hypothetical protein